MFRILTLVVLIALNAVKGAFIPGPGCSHDGTFYPSGRTVVVSCTDCVCESGEIKCPTPLVCPKSCHYQGEERDHGSSWKHFCNTCTCTNGDIICDMKQCEDSCNVDMGKKIRKGDTFKRDCNTCTCKGSDVITCTKKTCHCFDENEGKIIDNGGFYKDADCNQCVCRDGVSKCTTGSSCKKGCFFNNTSLRDGEKTTISCLVFQCNDGNPIVVGNNCLQNGNAEVKLD